MCLYPNLIPNPKYKKNIKNGGNVPLCTDPRILYVPVGCGKCMECGNKKKREWQVRLNEEIRNNKNGKFITLTFSSDEYVKLLKETKKEGYEGDNATATLAMRRFLERWRKKHKKSVKHWFITELGGGRYEHLHMHGILWTDENIKEIEEKWKYGYVHQGEYVNERTINYIVKYLHKEDEKHKAYKPIILCSSGIGKGYNKRGDANNNKYKEGKTDETYKTRSGIKLAMPIYYRNKIYTENEREKLWIEKLDKEERYVNGERIDVSSKEGEEQYRKLRDYYRNKSSQLGYGKPIEWKDWHYENERRKMLQKERTEEIEYKTSEIKLNNELNDIW